MHVCNYYSRTRFEIDYICIGNSEKEVKLILFNHYFVARGMLHNTIGLINCQYNYYNYVGRKVWICAIHGLRCPRLPGSLAGPFLGLYRSQAGVALASLY